MKLTATASLLLLSLSCTSPSSAAPVDVFAGFEGDWAGVFVGYDPAGRELYRLSVRQSYRTVDDTTQTVEIRDTMPDGTVVTGRGKNTAVRLADGSLQLSCVVDKSNGDHVEHAGRLVDGPDGDQQIVWSSVSETRVETFREWVHDRGQRYSIHGMGRYGDGLVLMAGVYRKQAR